MLIKYSKDDVYNIIKGILRKRFDIVMDDCGKNTVQDYYDNVLCFSPRDLVYVFFDIEDRFQIVFRQDEITQSNFGTFKKISELIYHKVNFDA